MNTTPHPDFLDIDSLLTSEQRLTQSSVREFVTTELNPIITASYMNEEFPSQVIASLGELGVLGSHLSGYGLPGLDAVASGLIMRELERCDSGLRSFASVQGSLVMHAIHTFGSETQKEQWLPELAAGRAVGCFGLTESHGGSEPGAMKTRAKEMADGWLINGSKMWITNGNLARIAIIWAQTNEGIRAFLLPTTAKGFTTRKMTGKLSLRASVTSELYFDNVKVPKDAVLPGAQGLKSALSCLTQGRYGVLWGVVGSAEACFDEAVEFTRNRVLFGKSLDSFQLVQAKLAKLLTRITSSQLLAYRLAQLKDQGTLSHAQISMGKQHNVEAARFVASTCRDILGANGIMSEYSVMRHLCNLETVYTYEGTNDIQLLILGREITGKAAFDGK